jgi:DNA-binding MarR family transcriptional regulator
MDLSPDRAYAQAMSEERDDSEDEAGGVPLGLLGETVGYALRRAQLAVFADFIRSFAPLDIRPGQFSVLLVLHQTPGLRQSQVADALGIKRANFVTLLDGLEARGLTRRETVPTDRRAVALYLTEAGEALAQDMLSLWRAHEDRVTARLGEAGKAQLLALLAKLVEL